MKPIHFLSGLLALACTLPACSDTTLRKADVLKEMKAVADWQIKNFDTPERIGTQDNKREADLDWTCGALYIGMYDWAALAEQVNGDATYFDWLKTIGSRNGWRCGTQPYHADHITVAQTWLRMADKFNDPTMAAPSVERATYVVDHPITETGLNFDFKTNKGVVKRWCWCDALFMAPPVYVAMYNRTGQKKFLDFENSEFRATTRILFDRDENLYYRDSRYIGMQEKNGQPVFWGRGNGWVIAGLANLLKIYPKSDKEGVKYYTTLFKKLATRLAEIQQPDGYWHASLLDPQSYPTPETSSTGFITYGLAWGINAGLLSKAKFLPVVEKGWRALNAAVGSDGKLGWVQPVGADPQKVKSTDTAVYGPGAFLSAGNEIYKLAK